MKHVFTPLFSFLICLLTVQMTAQPRLNIGTGNLFVEPGDTACLDFRIDDFNKIQEMNFSIVWNPLTVLNVQLGPDVLPPDALVEVDEEEGILSFAWKVMDTTACPPLDSFLTLPDGSQLFSICFEGGSGSTEMTIGDSYVTRVYSCPIDIGLLKDTIFIDTGILFVGTSSPEAGQLLVYPNPASREVYFELNARSQRPEGMGVWSCKLLNAWGERLGTAEMSGSRGSFVLPAAGVYYLLFYAGDKLVKVERVVCTK